ncbi:hypothetical protein PFISCL1PPCAC_5057, partial [Pristionchus fissidentatus]
VLPFIKKHLPYTWALVEKKWAPIKTELEKMTKETRAYLHGIEELILEVIVKLSQNVDENLDVFTNAALREGSALVKKAAVMYQELPETNKIELEIYSCIRTLTRVFVETGIYDQYQSIFDEYMNEK